MIRFMKLLALFALFSTAAVAQMAPSWAGAFGDDAFLKANGAALRDHRGTGHAVQLRGVNLGGWLEWQDWMCPMDSSKTLPDANPGHNGYDFGLRGLLVKRFGPAVAEDLINTYEDAWITARDLDNIKALGMNAVRAPFAYDTLLDEKGAWRVDAFKRLDWLVQAAWERGIYTIIDYHAFLPSGAEQDGSATGYWSNAAQLNETAQIWTRIAEHYRGNPAVAMYDLLNEPNNSAPNGKPAARQGRNRHAIYTTGSTMPSVRPTPIMPSPWKGYGIGRRCAIRGRAGYRNVVYSLHWYHWGQKNLADNNAGTDGGRAQCGQVADAPGRFPV